MIVVLGPRWKLHEYMHLKESFVKWGQIVGHDTVIGLLGKTGNAAKTPPPALHDSDTHTAFPAIQ